VELHIRRIEGGRFTGQVFGAMRPGDRVRFEGPLGSFFLREDSEKPIIFVAGSTGFAPVKSMLEYAFSRGMKRRMLLYWGAKSLKDLYLADLPRRWEKDHGNFTFVPVLSEPAPEDRWQGRTGLVHEAILADLPDLGPYQVYACGSAAMVEAAYPAFRARGLAPGGARAAKRARGEPHPRGAHRPRAAEQPGPGEGADDVVDQEGNGEQEEHRAGGRGPDLEGEEIGDRVGDEEADRRRFHGDPQAALEHAQPGALEEVAVGGQGESGPDHQPVPLPEAHPHHQPERHQQEQRHRRDGQRRRRR